MLVCACVYMCVYVLVFLVCDSLRDVEWFVSWVRFSFACKCDCVHVVLLRLWLLFAIDCTMLLGLLLIVSCCVLVCVLCVCVWCV